MHIPRTDQNRPRYVHLAIAIDIYLSCTFKISYVNTTNEVWWLIDSSLASQEIMVVCVYLGGVFRLVKFLTQKLLPRPAPFAGGIKFATQI